MSGQLLVGEPDREREKHLRVRIAFGDGGHDLRFVDQRTFGHLMVADLVPDAFDKNALVPEPIVHIAADPLEDAFDAGRSSSPCAAAGPASSGPSSTSP